MTLSGRVRKKPARQVREGSLPADGGTGDGNVRRWPYC
jgi:hypothetical protein